ncbi:MAG: GHKL domain-containing protein [Clostridia bacterium]|nr:GHKL domain-containing protein [Clostridia bacterium]
MRSVLGKTVFSRILLINIAVVMVCISLLGSVQLFQVTKYISQKSEEMLARNAESIVGLIQSNISLESLQAIMDGFSRNNQGHIMVIDQRGNVVANTSKSGYCAETPAFIPKEHSRTVLNGKRASVIGNMGGLFRETMFTLQVPVNQANGKTLGAVLISIPIPEKERMTREFTRILLSSALLVLVISVVLSYALSKLISMPIKSIRTSAKAFARGELNSRVGEDATRSGISEISELACTFNDMAEKLEKAEDTRKAFISDVSHELRTPMTTISGFVNGVLDDTIPPEKQKEYLQIVGDEVHRLSRLVNTFLDISRMQSGKIVMQKTNFDINEAIRLTIIGLGQRLDEKRIRVSLGFEHENCYVLADADSIKRVLTNLLDNAVKFTGEDGEISVTVTQKQHEVFVSIHNTGCGIPEEQQKMIFERLYKVDQSRSINREGTGIGLYLVKNIIQAHGKHISVRSVENEYAEFTFSLDKGKAPGRREELCLDEE